MLHQTPRQCEVLNLHCGGTAFFASLPLLSHSQSTCRSSRPGLCMQYAHVTQCDVTIALAVSKNRSTFRKGTLFQRRWCRCTASALSVVFIYRNVQSYIRSMHCAIHTHTITMVTVIDDAHTSHNVIYECIHETHGAHSFEYGTKWRDAQAKNEYKLEVVRCKRCITSTIL